MRHHIIEPAPTSSATTEKTEPEVVAAISSAEGGANLLLALRSGRRAFDIARPQLLLAAAIALGCGAALWLRSRA